MHSTTACSGGLIYSPTMSRTLSISCGSGDSLKAFLRWGRGPKACRLRLMVMRLSPVVRASERVLQWVAPGGVASSVVMTTTCSTWSSVTVPPRS